MNKLKGDLSPNYVMKYFLKRKHQGGLKKSCKVENRIEKEIVFIMS